MDSLHEMTAAFAHRCRGAGMADTPQRRLIYQCLAESLDHPTAEAVYLRVKPVLPKVSLATVYRNLKLFADAGLIDEVATGSSLSRYDANQDEHHHLICKGCGSVADYYDERLDSAGVLGAVAIVERHAGATIEGAVSEGATIERGEGATIERGAGATIEGGAATVIDGFEVHGAKVNVFGLCRNCRGVAASDGNRISDSQASRRLRHTAAAEETSGNK